nr:hypothetical protein [Maliibacterium massiliense]
MEQQDMQLEQQAQQQSGWKKRLDKLKGKGGMEIVIAIIVLAVILIIYASSWKKPASGARQDTEPSQQDSAPSSEAGDAQEQKLEALLSQMAGAGQVRVMITYESGPEIVPALSSERQSNETEDGARATRATTESERPATQSGDGAALVLKEMAPQVKGVVILAEGAKDIAVRMNLLQAAQTVLQVDANRVEVFCMQQNDGAQQQQP